MKTKITIIVPCYNVERFVGRCLESILNNTCGNFEVIAVNDASTDGTLEIIENYSRKDNRIRVLNLIENVGLGGVRDAGIAETKTKYVMFVDSDDFLHPDTIKICTETINKFDPDLLEFDYVNVSTDEIKEINEDFSVEVIMDNKKIIGLIDNISCNKVFKVSIIRSNNLAFKYRLFEDTHFTTEYALNCKNAVKINLALYFYFNNQVSLTHSFRKDYFAIMVERFLETYNLLLSANLLQEADNYVRNGLKTIFNKLYVADVSLEYDIYESNIPLASLFNTLIRSKNVGNLTFLMRSLAIIEKKHVFKTVLKGLMR